MPLRTPHILWFRQDRHFYFRFVFLLLRKAKQRYNKTMMCPQKVWLFGGTSNLIQSVTSVRSPLFILQLKRFFPHQSGINSLSRTILLFSKSTSISMSPLSLSNCIIYSLHAPHGAPTLPSSTTATILSI